MMVPMSWAYISEPQSAHIQDHLKPQGDAIQSSQKLRFFAVVLMGRFVFAFLSFELQVRLWVRGVGTYLLDARIKTLQASGMRCNFGHATPRERSSGGNASLSRATEDRTVGRETA